ncbi:MAG: hypothetical protein DRJ29_17945 [Bacteroidetes bacterium]|nr:MAG: hypothetical protein DRJ29_17945 [Bacteroidota bacterium]
MRLHKLSILLSLAAIFVSCNLQAAKIDTIYFQNGDRITAEVKYLENNQLKLSTDNASTVYVEWDQVDSVKILNTMRIVMDDGQILYGKILPAGEAGKCFIWSSLGDPHLYELVHIVSLTPLKDKLFNRLSGSLSSGFSYVKATQVTQLNFDGSIKYQAEKNQIELSYSGLFSHDSTKGYSQNQIGGATFIRLLPNKWFLLSQFTLESNSEMNLDLRTSITAAAGYSFVRTNRSYLYAALGLMANRELSMGDGQNNLEADLTARYSVFIFDDPEVSFDLTTELIPSLTTLGRVRTKIDTNLKWEIFNDFYLKWTFWYNFDSQPLSTEAEKNDWAVTLIGVEYKL